MNISTDQAISELIQAKSDATQQKIAFAVAGKQLDAQKTQGDLIVKMIEQVASVQKQINSGRLDVRI